MVRVVIAVATVLSGRLGRAGGVAAAALRAAAQLGAVALLVTAVLRSWWASAGFITVMVLVAAATSACRVSSLRLGWPVLAPIAVGALPACALIVASGTVPLTEVAVVPVAGIRPSVGQALVPALDQTRTVGLVTLSVPSWACCSAAAHPSRLGRPNC